jgi:hypothetical protein
VKVTSGGVEEAIRKKEICGKKKYGRELRKALIAYKVSEYLFVVLPSTWYRLRTYI